MPSAKLNGKTTTEGSRRKQSHPSQLHGDHQTQKTIAEHFSTSKPVQGRDADEFASSPPSKRLKLAHTAEATRKAPQSRTTRGEHMYNFPSSPGRNRDDVIDLTSPTKGSPRTGMGPNGVVRPSGAAAINGPKKLVVKNLKRPSGPDQNQYYNNVLSKLQDALSAIFQGEKVIHSKETLYNEVMIVCRQNKAPLLYEELQKRFMNHVGQRIRSSLEATASTTSDVTYLTSVIEAWRLWSNQLEVVRSIFFFLDRSYLLHQGLPSIHQMGVDNFRKFVLETDPSKSKVLQGVCDLVKAEREQQAQIPSTGLLKEAIQMFHALSVYNSYFEPKLLAESQDFYLKWVEQTAASTDLAGYVEMCDRLMSLEMERSDTWGLDPTTTKQLEMHLEEILIEEREQWLLKVDDVAVLLGRDDPNILHRLYQLLQRRRLGMKLKPAFEDFIIEQGSAIVFDEAREQEMVVRLLNFKKKLDRFWDDAFEKNVDLGHTLREAFETFINKSKRSNMTWGTDNPKPGEMVAKYVDMVLKDGAKAIRSSGPITEGASKTAEQDFEASSEDEDTEITKQLDQVLDLFRFVHGKAVFEAFYKRDLARRLLLGRSASSDAEKSMLTRLKSGKLILTRRFVLVS